MNYCTVTWSFPLSEPSLAVMIAVPVPGKVAVPLAGSANFTTVLLLEVQVVVEVTSVLPEDAVKFTAGPPLLNFPAVPHGVMISPVGSVAVTVSLTPL